jgi:hypothetical protein
MVVLLMLYWSVGKVVVDDPPRPSASLANNQGCWAYPGCTELGYL